MKVLYVCFGISLLLLSCDKNEVGDISLGVFTTQDIKLNTMVDPIVTGVTCHVASIEADLSLSDPSDSSIACRQTGEISAAMIATIDKSKSGEIVFKKFNIRLNYIIVSAVLITITIIVLLINF